jgi:outer membrane receptor for ferrienterochelin and colicins
VNGYESISGQINLEFRKPEEQKKMIFINVYGNEKARAEANLHFAARLNKKWTSMLFTHASDQSMKQDENKDGFLDMPLIRQYNAFNRWNFHNQKNFEAQFGVKGLYETRMGGQLSSGATDADSLPAYRIGITTKQLEYFTKTGFLFPSTPYRSIGIQTSGKWQELNMFFGTRNYKGEEKNLYINAIYADIFGNTNHKYKVGLSYLADEYRESFADSAFNHFDNVPGAFAEYTYTHKEDFSLVAGVREDLQDEEEFVFTPRLHLRYNPWKKTTLRFSGGSGYRKANVFVENQSVLASSRQLVVNEKLRAERAWNFGFSLNQKFKIFGNEAFFNLDLFRTDFQQQVILNLEDPDKVIFSNLKGASYSNSLQADLGMSPFTGFDLKLAYKWYNVMTSYGDTLKEKPFVPGNRVMVNLAYVTYMDIWKFDVTANWFSGVRIPSTLTNPLQDQRPQRSPDYYLLQAQITKKFKRFDVYLGCENILNYTQNNPIIAPETPFGSNFDASMVYAPLDGRTIYFGLRMEIIKIKKE